MDGAFFMGLLMSWPVLVFIAIFSWVRSEIIGKQTIRARIEISIAYFLAIVTAIRALIHWV